MNWSGCVKFYWVPCETRWIKNSGLSTLWSWIVVVLIGCSQSLAADQKLEFEQSHSGLCEMLLSQSGQLTSAELLKERLESMATYLTELAAHHEGRGTRPYVLSTPDAARHLEGTFGPIISTTTFSRELTNEEYLRIAGQIGGFLNGLPQGRSIIASGGTMGSRSDASTSGGGVGILQKMAMQLGFKTLSITATGGFKYRAAPADYLLFSLDGFGSESRMMFELSKALFVLGGGAQAFNEATEYLVYNPKGILVLVDDPKIGGSSSTLLDDPRFLELSRLHPNIIVAKSGSEAGILLSEKLGINSAPTHVREASKRGINVLNPNADLHQLLPNSLIVGFSGWSDYGKSGVDLQDKYSEISANIAKVLSKIHNLITKSGKNVFYATAGNDPSFESGAQSFETLVHELPGTPNVNYIALTARSLKLNELNSRVQNISYIADTWSERTQQLVSRVDVFITAGGNQAVIDQTINAAHLERRQIHILGGNTLSDLRISRIKNPNLKCLTPDEVLGMSDSDLLAAMGL